MVLFSRSHQSAQMFLKPQSIQNMFTENKKARFYVPTCISLSLHPFELMLSAVWYNTWMCAVWV